MRGTKAKMLRRIARDKSQGLPQAEYYVKNPSRRRLFKNPLTGHKSYIEPPGTFALASLCTRKIYKESKKVYKEV